MLVAENPGTPETMQVLFVEDDPDDVFLIQHACKKAGLQARNEFFPNGRAAASHLSQAVGTSPLPKMIFLDLNMPLMGGFDFLAWLRQQPALKLVPVVVLTTSENPQDMLRAYQLGANDYIIKPTSNSGLASMLSGAEQFWLGLNRLP